MNFPVAADIRRILILKEDKCSAQAVRQLAQETFPTAHYEVVQRVTEAAEVMAAAPVDLWLTGVAALDGDALDFIAEECAIRRRLRYALVVTVRRELHILLSLRTVPLGGVFDLKEEEPAQLKEAMLSVVNGRPYWSPGVLARLRQHLAQPGPLTKLLTPVERVVFAVIGAGIDDQTAAERLGMKPSSVHCVRRSLHHKLGLQHKGSLVQLAIEYGFVRFTPEGVVRPGFALLCQACLPKSKFLKRMSPLDWDSMSAC